MYRRKPSCPSDVKIRPTQFKTQTHSIKNTANQQKWDKSEVRIEGHKARKKEREREEGRERERKRRAECLEGKRGKGRNKEGRR